MSETSESDSEFNEIDRLMEERKKNILNIDEEYKNLKILYDNYIKINDNDKIQKYDELIIQYEKLKIAYENFNIENRLKYKNEKIEKILLDIKGIKKPEEIKIYKKEDKEVQEVQEDKEDEEDEEFKFDPEIDVSSNEEVKDNEKLPKTIPIISISSNDTPKNNIYEDSNMEKQKNPRIILQNIDNIDEYYSDIIEFADIDIIINGNKIQINEKNQEKKIQDENLLHIEANRRFLEALNKFLANYKYIAKENKLYTLYDVNNYNVVCIIANFDNLYIIQIKENFYNKNQKILQKSNKEQVKENLQPIYEKYNLQTLLS